MLAPITPPIHPASPSPDPAGPPLPWLEWIILPVTTVALAQLVALEIYAQLVLGQWAGPQNWVRSDPPGSQRAKRRPSLNAKRAFSTGDIGRNANGAPS